MVAAAILNFGKYAFFHLTVAFDVRFSTFPLKLVRIDPIVKTWQHNFESQNGSGRHLESWWTCILYVTVAFFVRFSTFPVKFGDDWSINKELATQFRKSNWRRTPSWILVNMRFYLTVAFFVRFSTFPLNLVRLGPIVGKWQHNFEIQNGGGRHLELW